MAELEVELSVSGTAEGLLHFQTNGVRAAANVGYLIDDSLTLGLQGSGCFPYCAAPINVAYGFNFLTNTVLPQSEMEIPGRVG